MLPAVSRCIQNKQWQHVAAMEGRSIDAVRCQYDTTYLRADPVEAVKAIETAKYISTAQIARSEKYLRNQASRAKRLEQMTDAERNFAHWLMTWRKDSGLNNRDIAIITGCSASTISDICNLKVFPSAGVQAKILAGYQRKCGQVAA